MENNVSTLTEARKYAKDTFEKLNDKREALFIIYLTLINLIEESEVLNLIDSLERYYKTLDFCENDDIIRAIYEFKIYKGSNKNE